MGSQAGQQLLLLAVLVLAFALLVVRPQRARAKAMRDVRASLAVGSSVLTTAGLYATVVELDGEVVVLEIAPGVRARFVTGAVLRVLDAGDRSGDRQVGGGPAGAPPAG